MLELNSHPQNQNKPRRCSHVAFSGNQSIKLTVCEQGKHSDCVFFVSAAPAKTQHVNYVLTAQPNRKVYNSLQMLSGKLTAIY